MKKIEIILVESYLTSAERKLEEARKEIKTCGKMTLGLESRFSDAIAEVVRIRRTVESWEKDGIGETFAE